MNLLIPSVVVAALVAAGLYGVLARRNLVMVLIGAELIVNSGILLLVLTDARRVATGEHPLLTGQVGALFIITVAAAEIGLALAVALLLFRAAGSIDLLDTAADLDPADLDTELKTTELKTTELTATELNATSLDAAEQGGTR